MNSILLEMAIPYLDSAGELNSLQEMLNNISAFCYDFFHKNNKRKETKQIEKIAEAYLGLYREKFGAISGDNAKYLITICVGSIRRNINDFSHGSGKYYKPVKNLLKIREESFKLDKERAEFAKSLNLSLWRATLKATEKQESNGKENN